MRLSCLSILALLAGCTARPPAEAPRHDLIVRGGTILDGSFDAKLALGGGRELVADLEAAVAAHPFRERLHGHLALALYRAGRQTDALRSLADARRVLAEEIGIDPGPDLRRLEADILAQAPHLDPGS